MPPSFLLVVPLEVLLDIVSRLPVQDQGCLRLACKALEASVFDSFAQRFFSEKTILRTESSLMALLDISRSRMSAYLKHIVIQAHLIAPDTTSSVFRDENSDIMGSDVNLWISCLNMALLDQQAFLATGRYTEMLSEVFANVSPERIQIIGSPEENPDVNSSCVTTILYALAKAGSTPRVLELYQANAGFEDPAFHIPDSMMELVKPALARVESLSIEACLKTSRRMAPLLGGGTSNLNSVDALSRFLRCFGNLKSLRLDSYGCRDIGTFFRWLAAPVHLDPQTSRVPLDRSNLIKNFGQYTASEPPLEELADATYIATLLRVCQPLPTVQFQHLEALELVNTRAGWPSIIRLLGKLQPSLRTLRLASVVLLEERARVPWCETEVRDAWSEFTQQLLSSNMSRTLRNLTVSDPHIGNINQNAMKVTFFICGDALDEYSYSGPRMEDGLSTMLEAIRAGEREPIKAALSRSDRGNLVLLGLAPQRHNGLYMLRSRFHIDISPRAADTESWLSAARSRGRFTADAPTSLTP